MQKQRRKWRERLNGMGISAKEHLQSPKSWAVALSVPIILAFVMWLVRIPYTSITETAIAAKDTADVASKKADSNSRAIMNNTAQVTALRTELQNQRRLDSVGQVFKDYKVENQMVEIAKAVGARVTLSPQKPDTMKDSLP